MTPHQVAVGEESKLAVNRTRSNTPYAEDAQELKPS
ncbi:hypothetical protein P3T26_004305 [Streptomyces sp. MAA16]|nr:hypothetical protein [Streptomyces sp. MAA16]